MKVICGISLCILFAVVSIFAMGKIFSQPAAYANEIVSIDSKITATMKLTASATAASAGLSAIPGDAGTPIAERLADFSEYGFLIICVLYAEKYLMPILGEACFCYLIPGICVLYGLALITRARKGLSILTKIAFVSLAIWAVIPLSIRFSDKIYTVYEFSLEQTVSDANEFSNETAPFLQADSDQNAVQKLLTSLKTTVSGIADRGTRLLNRFTESMAVLIVTSCVIPLLVLTFSLWLIRTVIGIDIAVMPLGRRNRHQLKHYDAAAIAETGEEV